ncbi:NAD(P)H-hydrate dehydratase [Litoribacter ruber]|uniref:NAD(P)H-hydrate dehydratase n=1 Tax=Litoribacter ruber TaxID=702568 RepID=UPI001BD93B23|nr:NAD(P)H-hydrate dehydratase [Litoribacter ruber]MBT0811300.1 NAD(P)H-hydrate dehydratase [Litoribacter ruber]
MLKILSARQIKSLEESYLEEKGILSLELMETAAEAFCQWYMQNFSRRQDIAIFCGTGNNGGDGIAIARLLSRQGYPVCVYTLGDAKDGTADYNSNLNILPTNIVNKPFSNIDWERFRCHVIIDAMLGIGLNKPLEGKYLDAVKKLNSQKTMRIAVDMPTGLPSDKLVDGEAFQAHYTVTFQTPKLSALFPEHAAYVGDLVVKDIGIDGKYFNGYESSRFFVEEKDILERHKIFHKASHKGDFGKVLLVGGSKGKLGAIMLSAKAALRTGSGLISTFVPGFGLPIMQSSIHEVMVETCTGNDILDSAPENLDRFDTIAIGPGMGTDEKTAEALKNILESYKGKMVIDADALNIIAKRKDLKELITSQMILTPHLKEFERMVGDDVKYPEGRIEKALEFSQTYGCVLILKGLHSLITTPAGIQYFNPTGSQFLATGGTGDVLTGVVASYLGQGYSVENAALCGVYHHGLAGQLAGEDQRRGTIASDVIEKIPETYKNLGLS